MLSHMDAAFLRDLLTPFLPAAEADDVLLECIRVHLELLMRWNQRMNLTSLRTPEAIVQRHFGESLFAARKLCPRTAQLSLIDVGSGAGFPGLPIKYWAPGLKVTLVEGHGKKATFLREVCRAMPHLADVLVLNARAESLSCQTAELVTLRAVEQFEQVLPVAAGLVAPGGRLAMLIGESQRERVLDLLPGGESSAVAIPSSEHRLLVTWHRLRAGGFT
jgi:16S rRNA (guanine527-N7)-methyltransferase